MIRPHVMHSHDGRWLVLYPSNSGKPFRRMCNTWTEAIAYALGPGQRWVRR